MMSDDHSKSINHLLLSIMERIADCMEAERTTLFLYDEIRDELWSICVSGGDIDEIRMPASQGIAGYVMSSRETLNIPDAYADARFNAEVDRQSGFHTRTILCQPVSNYQGRCIGVVQVLNKNTGVFDQHDEKMLAALSGQSAIAIENSQLYANVSRLREREQILSKALAGKHKELQTAYLTMETQNRHLLNRLKGVKFRRHLTILLVVLLCIGLSVWWLLMPHTTEISILSDIENIYTPLQNQETVKIDHTFLIETQEVRDFLRLKGKVRPINWVEILSPIDSVVTEQYFHYGESVSKGQLLLRLDTRIQQRLLRHANTAFIQAQESVNILHNWQNSLEVVRARRELGREKEQLMQQKRSVQESQRLYDKGIIAGNELQETQSALREQQLTVISYQETLQSILDNGGRNQLRIAELTLENARQQVDELKENIKNSAVYSPTDGVLFAGIDNDVKQKQKEKLIRVGSHVSKNTALLAVADFKGIAMESYVPEEQLFALKYQQAASIKIEAVEGLSLQGIIRYIAGRANSSTEQGSNSTTFKVELAVSNITAEQRARLRIGMSAEALVETYFNPKAIVVPFEAIMIQDDTRYVMVLDKHDVAQKRDIEIRTSLQDGVEISAGLSVGETILLAH
jgi:multidrug efflux pump subunit AcrA (membrane-fusion protein)